MLLLYYIGHTNDDGDDFSAFAIAHDSDEAERLWREWHMVTDYYDAAPNPEYVFEVKPARIYGDEHPRLLQWHRDVVEP